MRSPAISHGRHSVYGMSESESERVHALVSLQAQYLKIIARGNFIRLSTLVQLGTETNLLDFELKRSERPNMVEQSLKIIRNALL